ncbi:MAG: biotin/lipoyl-binding protein, partial [Clostridia bacterium]|nr:biotin/lipoyl-binding protein [Clostridia bacterium]
MKKHQKGLIGLIVLIVLAAAVCLALRAFPSSSASQDSASTGSYTVGRGDVKATITGSGQLEAEDSTEILLPEGIKVETIFVKTGDTVEQDDVLATLDVASLQYRAAELSAELTALDQELGARKTASSIKAPVSGRIKYLPAAQGDDVIEAVNQYGSLAILSTDGMMQVALKTEAKLTLNASVQVRWNGGSETGKVASRIDGGYLITLDDASAPYLSPADVYDDAALIGSGVLDMHAPVAIFGNGGTIKTVHYREGTKVDANATLFTLDNEPATDKYRQALADRNEKAAQLQTILMYQNSPSVLAGVSGTVSEIGVTEQKKLASDDDSGEVSAFTLGTGGATKMTVSVDELDIGSVAVGQSATVTLDAFSTEEFAAAVTRISHIGEASGSITVYETDLRLPYDERLMDGMNGSAVILSESARNVIVIPLEAVGEDEGGSFVYVLGSDNAQTKTYIQTGLSDGTYAEVTGGLKEGDRIAYQPRAGVSSTV